jgi:hypothetical protein
LFVCLYLNKKDGNCRILVFPQLPIILFTNATTITLFLSAATMVKTILILGGSFGGLSVAHS